MTYLTTRDVADVLGMRHTEYVVALIAKGMLPCERVRLASNGRKLYRITPQELCAYLEAYDPALLPLVKQRWPEAA